MKHKINDTIAPSKYFAFRGHGLSFVLRTGYQVPKFTLGTSLFYNFSVPGTLMRGEKDYERAPLSAEQDGKFQSALLNKV
ncbi:hypothetical protein J2Z58_000786 [Halobacillus andaensis]|nr:hypothetical protein [Halobacillus andaensis]